MLPQIFQSVSSIDKPGVPRALLLFLTANFAVSPIFAQSAPVVPTKADTIQLSKLVVSDKKDSVAPPISDSKIAGGANVVLSEEFDRGVASNAADALAYQPGIIVQASGGRNEAVKLSIRGSGVQSGGPVNNTSKSVSVFLDGLPLLSPAAYPYEALESLAVSYIEVLRGGNAFDYGALNLGGGVNFASHTGYDAAPLQLRFEAGSFGYFKEQISSGKVIGPADYYLSVTNFRQHGFRDNATAKSQRIISNVGYRFSREVATRFYFYYAHQDIRNPQTITLAQLYDNPRQVTATVSSRKLYREAPGTYILANRTTYRIDANSSLEFGAQFKEFPSNINLTSVDPQAWRDRYADISGTVKYNRKGSFFGVPSSTTVTLLGSKIVTGEKKYFGDVGSPSYNQLLQTNAFGGANAVLVASNEIEARPDLWIDSGVALSYASRESELTFPLHDRVSDNYLNLAPRVGVRFNTNPDLQLFGNVSRSIEPPTVTGTAAGAPPNAGIAVRNLYEQTATTAEIGARGKAGIFQGSIAYYYSWVQNEILSVEVSPGTRVTSNASPTIHQGLELGLDTTLWQVASVVPEARPRHRLWLKQAYTWGDFHYRNDRLLSRNELPGLPAHYYQGELSYDHGSGFFAGINVKSVLSKFAADFANTLFAKPYTLFGARLGYNPPNKGWRVYVEFQNLTDRKYVSVINPSYTALGRDAALFWPGDGFNITGGVGFRF